MAQLILNWINRINKKLKQRLVVAVLATAGLGVFVMGYRLGSGGGREGSGIAATQPATQPADHSSHNEQPFAQTSVWTCSMHPQIRRPKPGKCPICAMDLIPVKNHGVQASGAAPRLTVTPQAAKLMEVQTSLVERRYVEAVIRMVGKIEYDETRLSYITTRVGGRIDRLYVDYTGIAVRKGEHIAQLYSPELLSAQEELIQAVRAVESLQHSNLGVVRETATATVAAVRDKLRLWGLTQEQIDRIEKQQTPNDHITISAPIGGIVIHKNAQEGMYVQTGTRIFTIADLSRLWVLFDAYESDLAWLRYGQHVRFMTEASPGEVFEGTVAFIDPVLDDKRRTVKVRVNVTNEGGRLKPGMFVRGTIKATVADSKRVIYPSLAGKWIGPMHPEVIKDQPGQCDICGMALVPVEQLGYASDHDLPPDKPLVVPASAVLITGTRAVIYVRLPGREMPTFEGREVTLGLRAGAYYIVSGNLSEGEEVVTNGNFKIDSAMQLAAKPSMMNPEGGAAAPSHQHGGGSHD